MTLAEARKLATPRPWRIEEHILCVPLHDEQGPPNWCTTTEEANAVLAKHCVDNFDDVVLALEECRAVMFPDNATHIPTVRLTGSPQDMDKLIARAKKLAP